MTTTHVPAGFQIRASFKIDWKSLIFIYQLERGVANKTLLK